MGTKARPGARAKAAPSKDGELREVVEQLALLTAMNNLMAQTAFLTVERMRISSEVVDEAIPNEFGAQLFERCERLVRASDDLVLQLVQRVGARGERAELLRGLVQMRREFVEQSRNRATRPEQRRLLESLERMYR